jgi:hypothetical protein
MLLRRILLLVGVTASAAATLGLTGCAGLNKTTAEVRSFGEWPAGRAPGAYVFERLPSQSQPGSQAAEMEALAAVALATAGFKPAANPAAADVVVAIGARVTRTDYSPWDDPLWLRWNAPLYAWRYGYPPRGFVHPFFPERRFEREVALLLRDKATGQPLFEARASNDGMTMGSEQNLRDLFSAALSDFPKAEPMPRWVTVQSTP